MIICKEFDIANTIHSIEEWKEKCPPAKKEHWVDGRSAKELAKDWIKNKGNDLEILLGSFPEFRGIKFIKAAPEYESRFDDYGKGRHHDLLILSSGKKGQVLISIEAKADEAFGPIIKDEYLKKIIDRLRGESTNLPDRIENLLQWIFNESLTPKVFDFRYQLLHGVAGLISEAKNRGINKAIFVIDVYRSDNSDLFSSEENQRNIKDLDRFVRHLSKDTIKKIKDYELYKLIKKDGIDVYLIKREQMI